MITLGSLMTVLFLNCSRTVLEPISHLHSSLYQIKVTTPTQNLPTHAQERFEKITFLLSFFFMQRALERYAHAQNCSRLPSIHITNGDWVWNSRNRFQNTSSPFTLASRAILDCPEWFPKCSVNVAYYCIYLTAEEQHVD